MGFGFMDNSIMIIAGNFIDCSVGVLLGLSTLSAAAIGQIVANGASVVFGGYVEALARRLGLPSAGLNSAQRSLPEIRRIGMFGNLCGVVVGAALGLIHLLWIDTARSTNLKLEAMSEEHEFAFTVEASNTQRHDATVFTIRGPDADGLLASLTAALATAGCAVRELHAKSTEDGTILDQIVVQTGGGGGTDGHHEPIPNEQLDQVARQLLAASRDPLMAHSLKTQNEELKQQNALLAQRVEKLERKLEDQQLTIVPTRT
jgi:tRNA-specific adenosine deaminase 1